MTAVHVHDLTGKLALVTGGNQGIGLAIASALSSAGATVVCASRSARTSSDGDSPFEAITLDVADEQSCVDAVEECSTRFGPVDVLVNNAGIAESSKFVETTTEQWRRHLTVDLDGPFWLIRAVLPSMLDRDSGAVVSVGSVASKVGLPYVAAYTAAKHGLVGLTRSLAAEHARSGVTFNCVCPYYVDTPMAEATISRIMQKTGRTRTQAAEHLVSPQGRLVAPDEVAALCVFLAGPHARSITGQAIHVDGGKVQS